MKWLGCPWLWVALALLGAACRVDATVDIRVEPDGSGEVALEVVADRAAVALVPDAPGGLLLADLQEAGWTLEGPAVEGGGALTLKASKRFERPQALGGVLGEIAGRNLILERFKISREYSFEVFEFGPARTNYSLSGRVNPDFDIERLGGEFEGGLPRLGRQVEEIAEAFEGEFADALGLTVTVRLPATLVETTGESIDDVLTWSVNYGDPAVEVEASSVSEDILVRVWTIVAFVAGILLVLVLGAYLASFLLAKWRVPKGRRRRDVRRRKTRAATRAQEASRPKRRSLRLLVVDVHGVLVRPTDPLSGVLQPLILAENPDIDPQRVRDAHRKLVLGRLSPDEFWEEVELSMFAQQLETRYLSSFRFMPGLHPFLERMKKSDLPVAAIGNQPRAWGVRLRRMTALDDLITSWMVSGDVGATLPEPALFEATRRTMSVDLFDCFYLSNVVANLDVAEELGMATGLFLTSDDVVPDTDHTKIYGFEDLLKTRGAPV